MGKDSTYDMPDTDEVLQTDEEHFSVPVTVEGSVRNDPLPGFLGACRNVLLGTAGRAQKLVEANPRRKRVVVWWFYAGSAPANNTPCVVMAPTEHEANSYAGAVLATFNAITRYEFETSSEIWVRGASVVNSSGDIVNVTDSTNDILISAVSEEWAR